MKKILYCCLIFIIGSAVGATISWYAVSKKFKSFLEVIFFERTLTNQSLNLSTLKNLRQNNTESLIILYEANACSYYMYLSDLGEGMEDHEVTLQTDQYFEKYYPNNEQCKLEKSRLK